MVVRAQVQSVVAGNTAFAQDLYGQLATNQGNLFFSPYSISTCLGMTYEGAAGSTEAQMSEVLGFGTNQQQFASLFGELQSDLEATEATNAIELNIANVLWTQEGFPFLPSFIETATNQYQANVNQVDFANAPGVTTEINNWVAQKTQNKIQNILAPGSVAGNTVLVLANAIYFLGTWTESFAVSNTTIAPFYLSTNSQVSVPLMHQLAPNIVGEQTSGIPFNYMQSSNFQAIELPYGTNQDSMLILLPSQVDGLAQLEKQLSPAFLSNVLAQMSPQSVEVYLPRFTLGSFFDLSGTLAAMGMPDAFTPYVANFSGMDGALDLYISFVVHKAWVQVNETGTEAAAATVVGVGATVVGLGPPVFRADHPFLFFIRDTQSGSLLFMGRVADPSQSGGAAPQLTFGLTDSKLKISWPYPSTGWTLRQNGDLTTTNWTSSSGVANDGTNNSITITPASGSMFFRLSQ
ncbi:MAG TPA: serpin family protein [Verrucomicrobiae bacterium]|nr:serpin family protein [Verrucomicrobiae bacterium]